MQVLRVFVIGCALVQLCCGVEDDSIVNELKKRLKKMEEAVDGVNKVHADVSAEKLSSQQKCIQEISKLDSKSKNKSAEWDAEIEKMKKYKSEIANASIRYIDLTARLSILEEINKEDSIMYDVDEIFEKGYLEMRNKSLDSRCFEFEKKPFHSLGNRTVAGSHSDSFLEKMIILSDDVAILLQEVRRAESKLKAAINDLFLLETMYSDAKKECQKHIDDLKKEIEDAIGNEEAAKKVVSQFAAQLAKLEDDIGKLRSRITALYDINGHLRTRIINIKEKFAPDRKCYNKLRHRVIAHSNIIKSASP